MAVNGYDTPYAPVARAPAVALDGEVGGGAALLGDGQRTTIGGAWLANSALFHGRAQQDTCGAAHFGAVLVLLLTAMIETWHYPLECLLPVLVTGYEAGGLLEGLCRPHPRPADSVRRRSTARSRRRRRANSWNLGRLDWPRR